jgi:peptidoglycan hydrolase-like protein with peptidoglycan-binding domain
MKRLFPLFLTLFALSAPAWADDQTQAVQQALKDQGFYYGQVDGQAGPETDAAVKRYQIRQGLDVTGKLDEPTLDSLNLASGAANRQTVEAVPQDSGNPTGATQEATPAPRVVQNDKEFLAHHPDPTPAPATPSDDDSTPPPQVRQAVQVPPPPAEQAGETLPSDYVRFLRKTPYETAPVVVQRSTVQRAQERLAREGFYRGVADAELSDTLSRALVAYQRDADLSPTGRLDMDTLADMNLLPARHMVIRALRPSIPDYDAYPPLPGRQIYRGLWVH